MNLFQILALAVVACLLAVTIVATVKRSVRGRESFAWILLWLVAGVAIAWPKLTGIIARILGIGRGADLVLYIAVVVMMVGFLMVYVRLRKLQCDLTILVRHIALREALAVSASVSERSENPGHSRSAPHST